MRNRIYAVLALAVWFDLAHLTGQGVSPARTPTLVPVGPATVQPTRKVGGAAAIRTLEQLPLAFARTGEAEFFARGQGYSERRDWERSRPRSTAV